MTQLFQHLNTVRYLIQQRPFGLFTDFDGTVSDIVSTPGEARISPVCRQHLISLSEKLSLVAIVSGRPVEALAVLSDVPGAVYIGNHGLERMTDGTVTLQQNASVHVASVKKTISSIKTELTKLAGVLIEDKGPVVAVHYRQSEDPTGTEKEILRLLEDREEIAIGRGKMVIEVRPPVEFSKGLAVRDRIIEHDLRSGIYMGDDLTDIDAMHEMKRSVRGTSFAGIGVAVTGEETPRELIEVSDLTLDGIQEVEGFLGWLEEKVS